MLKINGVIESRSKEKLNTITESEEITLNDNKFLQTVLNYLKGDTKVVIEPSRMYDGYNHYTYRLWISMGLLW